MIARFYWTVHVTVLEHIAETVLLPRQRYNVGIPHLYYQFPSIYLLSCRWMGIIIIRLIIVNASIILISVYAGLYTSVKCLVKVLQTINEMFSIREYVTE